MKIWEVDLNYGKKYACSDGGNYEVSMFKDNMFDSRGVAITQKYTLYQLLKMEFEEDVDWSKIPVDTKVLVSDDRIRWSRRYFKEYKNGCFITYPNGETSWSTKGSTMDWKYCKLYPEE